jgi:hypothetical protein
MSLKLPLAKNRNVSASQKVNTTDAYYEQTVLKVC